MRQSSIARLDTARHGFDLDQKLFFDKTIHHEKSVELDDIREACAETFEHGPEIVEHLRELSVEVVLAHHRSLSIYRQLSGDEQQRAAVDSAHVRIQPLRGACPFGIKIFDLASHHA